MVPSYICKLCRGAVLCYHVMVVCHALLPQYNSSSRSRFQLTRTRVLKMGGGSDKDDDNNSPRSVVSVAYHPYRSQLAAASDSQQIVLWNTETWQVEGIVVCNNSSSSNHNTSPTTSCCAQEIAYRPRRRPSNSSNPNETWVATRDQQGTVTIWSADTTPWTQTEVQLQMDTRDGEENTTTARNRTDDAAYSSPPSSFGPTLAWRPPWGDYLAASTHGQAPQPFAIWNTATWQSLRLPTENNDDAGLGHSVSWSAPDGQYFVVNGSTVYTFDALFQRVPLDTILFGPLWNSSSNGHDIVASAAPGLMQWKPDGSRIVAAVVVVRGGERLVIVGGNNGTLVELPLLLSLQRTSSSSAAAAAAASTTESVLSVSLLQWSPPDGAFLLAVLNTDVSGGGGDGGQDVVLRVWESSDWTRAPMEVVGGMFRVVQAVSWDARGRQLAVASDRGEIQIWNVHRVVDDDSVNEESAMDRQEKNFWAILLVSGLVSLLSLVTVVVALVTRLRILHRRHDLQESAFVSQGHQNSDIDSGEESNPSPVGELISKSGSNDTTSTVISHCSVVKGFLDDTQTVRVLKYA